MFDLRLTGEGACAMPQVRRYKRRLLFFVVGVVVARQLSSTFLSLGNSKCRYTCLRTFALIVIAHLYCAHTLCRNVTPLHASSARADKTFQTNIGACRHCVNFTCSFFSQTIGGPIFYRQSIFDRLLRNEQKSQ